IEGGPSEQVGIKGGDRIVMADNDSLTGKDLNERAVVDKLKGDINSKVNLKVYRKGEPELLNFTVKRSNIPIKSVDASYMLTEKLGYIKINRFARSEEHTSELQSRENLVCRLLLEK